MSTNIKAVSLGNSNYTYLPISDSKLIQHTHNNETSSVYDVIVENEETTAAALVNLNDTKQNKTVYLRLTSTTSGSTTTYSLPKTYDEILSLINNGTDVRIIINNEGIDIILYNITNINDPNGYQLIFWESHGGLFGGPEKFYYCGLYKNNNSENVGVDVFDLSDSFASKSHRHSDYASLASPAFTGTPTAPTASDTTNNTQIATTEFVNTAVHNLAKTQGVAYCTTAAATAAKTATLSNYALYIGGIVSVWFQYNVPANATLNINSKGDIQIRLRTTSSTSVQISANYIHAGDTATFIYDGKYYQLIGLNTDERVTAINTSDEEFYFIGVSASGGNTSNQQPKFSDAVYMNRHNQFVASEIKEGTTLLSDKYAPRLRYVLKAPSSNVISFTSTDTMLPERVYIVGTYPHLLAINSLSIGDNALDVTGYGYFEGGSTGSCPINNSLVPTYQIVFMASATFSSITLPSSVKWRDNYAPASTDMRGKVCELTIMNGIATMNMITVS